MKTFSNTCGNSFIDENHDSLLDHIEHLTNLVRFDFNPGIFKEKTKDLIKDLENHFMHEEMILNGADYSDIDQHSLEHRRIAMQLHSDNLELLTFEEATNFIIRLRTNVFTHELFSDQHYWPLFPATNENELLIKWGSEYETEHTETNRHHKALVNHVNRLHHRLQENPDKNLAIRELKNLYEYSQFHYLEEETFLGDNLWPGHKTNHEKLLIDLQTVIDEIGQDKFRVENIGAYLKYWLLNHIQLFDIPAFMNSPQNDSHQP